MMDAQPAALLEKIRAFRFEQGPTSITFADRLAKENGWRIAYADRVIEEYKRFLFLAMVAGHPVSPSDPVDQAWHLHLVYTRSYWDDLCRDVLGRPLHHGPTLGGAAEQQKHNDWYERTLESYRRWFDAEPPADIWPPLAHWRQKPTRYERVDRERFWLLPKVRLPKLVTKRRAAALGVFMLPLAATFNPLDMRGPQFLLFFIIAFAIALAIGVAVRIWGGDDDELLEKDAQLDASELAYLNGGQKQLTQAVVAGMLHEGSLELTHEKSGWFGLETVCLRAAQPLGGRSPVAQLIHKEASGPNGLAISGLPSVVTPLAERVKQSLEDRGLLGSGQLEFKAAVPMAIVLLLGIAKVGVGLWRDKPVGLLIGGCVIAMIATLLLMKSPRLTRKGRRIVAQWKEKHSNLAGGSANGTSISPADMMLSVAMFGLATTGPMHFQELRKALGPGNTSASCGTSCGGGGGCGGGGCGGGGCGGCGGGD
jgi:uncharacterized protein (TIGR04222 family)